MPGPGGSHGGGSRGGSFGGGSRGGGFGGGGFRGPGRGPHFGGFYHRPHFYGGRYRRPYGYGGGCLGGLMGMMLAPVFLILFAVALLLSTFGSVVDSFASVGRGGEIVYDEAAFQDYANAQYAAEFGDSAAYEDNILLVFLTAEDHYDYCYIAWVGDHIASDINRRFDSQGEFGRAVQANVNQSNYKYSLDADLSRVVEQMERAVVSLALPSSHRCEENRGATDSHLTNHTDMELTHETVNAALDSFTAATGIPMVVVVEDMEDVFGRTVSGQSLMLVVMALAFLAIAIYMIFRNIRNRPRKGDGDDRGERRDGDNDGGSRYAKSDW